MPDIPSHDAPQHDEARHTLTVRDVERMLAEAGVQRSHRHVLRLCQSGMLDAVKIPGDPSGEEWYVAAVSVPKAIGDLKQIDAQRARRGPTQPAVTDHDAVKIPHVVDTDTVRHGAAEPGMSDTKNIDNRGATQPAIARHVTAELDIFEHPYVKKLEARNDQLESKLEAQVRRTEEIQISNNKSLIELQRMTAVGQSQTLADFMLKARTFILGPQPDEASSNVEEPISP